MLTEKVEQLKKQLIDMAGIVENMIDSSCEGLFENNMKQLDLVFELEEKVNVLEIEIENETTSLIALFQPEARNLRSLLMIMKINNDLERIGDLAINIAKNANYLIETDKIKPFVDLPPMAKATKKMLHQTIQAFIDENPEQSHSVCLQDDVVDNLKDQIYRVLITYMISEPSTIKRAIHLMNIAQCLERIADLSTNIAEDNIFLCEGKMIKHHNDEEA